MSQFRDYLTQHSDGNIPAEDIAELQEHVTGKVLAIERRFGMSTLICEKIFNEESNSSKYTETPDKSEKSKKNSVKAEPSSAVKKSSRELFKVVLNPILTNLEVVVEDIVQIVGVSTSLTL